ncbi:ABC transporter permease subunit [Brevibacillus migulae]|uniref:ABC transporter permease subunit n=1 Tax=Brevibacillus migulae TaxID=1644114 RepID=UPI001F2BCBB0|nr:ABC transporter permease subunit [Brevibacillus migulae]
MLYTHKEEVVFEPERVVSRVVYLIEKFTEGSLGTYYLGVNEREIAEDILPFTLSSFELLFCSIMISVIISILLGLFMHRNRLSRIVQRVLDIISMVPDFILILFSIVLAIGFYKLTNIRLITLSPTSDAANNWFPTAVLALGPTIFLVKVVVLKYAEIAGEDYIKTALAKGLKLRHVQLHHVYKNIKPFLLADLKKAIAITVANLFIVEYSLNVVGLTRFIFTKGGGYQFNSSVMGLMGIILLSIFVYVLVRLFLYLFERTLVYR